MTILAMTPAVRFTLSLLVIFGVGFPLLVGSLLAFTAIQARGERQRFEESRRHTPLEPPHHLT